MEFKRPERPSVWDIWLDNYIEKTDGWTRQAAIDLKRKLAKTYYSCKG